jgi:hypothetical protein
MSIQPRHVLCILHHADLPLAAVCARFPGFEIDTEFSLREHDPRMPESFRVCADRIVPSMSPEDVAAIAAHTAVSYVLSPHLTQEDAFDNSRRALDLIAAAFAAGALAVKGESSGIAHGRNRWLGLAQNAKEEPEGALVKAWVRYPIATSAVFYSVGMHLLGWPDVEIVQGERPEDELVDGMSAFLFYLAVDRPDDLESGHGFRVSQDAPRFLISKVDADHHELDSFKYNPFGYWRLTYVES